MGEALVLTPDALHACFTRHTPVLDMQAAERVLAAALTQASVVAAVLISTCTDYLCPGPTSYVSERFGLHPDVQARSVPTNGFLTLATSERRQ